MRLIALLRPSASPAEKPASAIATWITWSWKTIAPSVSLKIGSSEGCSYGIYVVRILAKPSLAIEVGVDGAALDRPGANERHLHRQVVEVLRQRARQHLHLRPRLDLKDACRLGVLDGVVDLGVVEADAREVEALVSRARDLVDAALDRREHPQPEQVDLQESPRPRTSPCPT